MKDFTPTAVNGFPNSGKAHEFKKVLEQEIIPYIINELNVNQSNISIVGHHYSALFLTWLLTQNTGFQFSNYVICSPVLTLNEGFKNFQFDKKNTGIYLSSGAGKIIYIDEPELNKSRFDILNKELIEYISESKQLESNFYPSKLRYNDLYLGFCNGVNFINRHIEKSIIDEGKSYTNNLKPINESAIFIDHLTDKNTSFEYEISIFSPDNKSKDKLPVIVILDADFNYTELLNTAQKLIDEGKMSKSLIVGVGYGTTIIGRGNNRNRDFLPNKVNSMESGNGKQYAGFLNTQLISYLEKNYSISNQFTLHGHSYGGLFLAYLLSKENINYENLIISSPAIWQDKSVLKKLKLYDNPITQKIYLASGQIHDNDKDTKRLDKVLKKKTTSLSTKLYPNASHLTVISEAFEDGLMYLIEK
ncbi:alpha/beta hydrolase-fold protein [Chondrinema litorale]|uniref:alpha/beta hydrolase-fold protein n=1 Tax=Chondrinema litorale TaxID=2994555 RepID=UPI002542ED09|nr:alpha/beta hydrolase-fold protein [Chondrinema litorale]UZR96513.1 alpha/beta hydrolase-fold protein [Chondrinema litorale]